MVCLYNEILYNNKNESTVYQHGYIPKTLLGKNWKSRMNDEYTL